MSEYLHLMAGEDDGDVEACLDKPQIGPYNDPGELFELILAIAAWAVWIIAATAFIALAVMP